MRRSLLIVLTLAVGGVVASPALPAQSAGPAEAVIVVLHDGADSGAVARGHAQR